MIPKNQKLFSKIRTGTEKKLRNHGPARTRTGKLKKSRTISGQDQRNFENLGPILTGRSPNKAVRGSLGQSLNNDRGHDRS